MDVLETLYITTKALKYFTDLVINSPNIIEGELTEAVELESKVLVFTELSRFLTEDGSVNNFV